MAQTTMETPMARGAIPAGEALVMAELVNYSDGSVVSRTVAKGTAGSLTLFAFDAGEGLSEHASPFDAFVTILEGSIKLVIDGQEVIARTGEIVRMPADTPHALTAPERCKMLLTMFREQSD